MTEYESAVQKIRARFLGSIPGRLSESRRLAVQLLANIQTSSAAGMKSLHMQLHDLCGTSGMLGLDEIERIARKALAPLERADIAGRHLAKSELNSLLRRFDQIERRVSAISAKVPDYETP